MIDQNALENLVTMITAITPWITGGLAGAILTLVAKIWADRRKKKTLQIVAKSKRFTLDSDEKDELASKQGLKVSYLGNEYNDLLWYSTEIRNIGYGNINNQKIIFLLSSDTHILKEEIHIHPLAVSHSVNDAKTENGVEKCYEFPNISGDDVISISFLINSPSIEAIRLFPRGNDETEYSMNSGESLNQLESDIRKLLLYLAMFVLMGAMPFSEGIFQALVVISSIPTVSKIIINLKFMKRSEQLIINNLSVDGGSRVAIESK